MRQEAGAHLRVTGVSPGYGKTAFAGHMPEGDAKRQALAKMKEIASAPEAIARAIAFAIAQPADAHVADSADRPTAQG